MAIGSLKKKFKHLKHHMGIGKLKTNMSTQKQAEYQADIFKNEIHIVRIGNQSFTNNQLALFKPHGFTEEETVALLKKVFQERYPTTRNNGLPKVPSDKHDKELLLKALEIHFELQRAILVKSKDSLSARAELQHLQEIKILVEHFKHDKDTFPYHKFVDYLNNQDYIDAQEDITNALHNLLTSENEDDRIRKLLRQFAKVYLTNKDEHTFVINDPGLSSHDFKQLLEEAYTGKIEPSVLKELLEMLDNPMIVQGLQRDLALAKKEKENAQKERQFAIDAQRLLEKAKLDAEQAATTAKAEAALSSFAKDEAETKAINAEKAKQHALQAKAAAQAASLDAKANAQLEVERATAEANLAITAALQAEAKANSQRIIASAAEDKARASQLEAEIQASIAKTARETAEAALAISEASRIAAEEGESRAKMETSVVRTERNEARQLTKNEIAAKEKAERAKQIAERAKDESERISALKDVSIAQKEAARAAAVEAERVAKQALDDANYIIAQQDAYASKKTPSSEFGTGTESRGTNASTGTESRGTNASTGTETTTRDSTTETETLKNEANREFESVKIQRDDALADADKAKEKMQDAHRREEEAKKNLRAAYAEIEESVVAQEAADALLHQANANLLEAKGDIVAAKTERNSAVRNAKLAHRQSEKLLEEARRISNSKNATIAQKEEARRKAEAAKKSANAAAEEIARQRNISLEETKQARKETAEAIAGSSSKKAMIEAFSSQAAAAQSAADEAHKQTLHAIREKEIAEAQIQASRNEAETAREARELAQRDLAATQKLLQEAAEKHASAATMYEEQLQLGSISSSQKDREINRLKSQLDLVTGENEFINQLIKDAEKIPHSQIQTTESIQPIIMKALDRLSKIHDPIERHRIMKPFLTLIVKLLEAQPKKSRSVRNMASDFEDDSKKYIASQTDLRTQPQRKSFGNLEKTPSTRSMEGGAKLIKYCYEIANNTICDTPFSLIEEFENASGQDVRKTAHEQFMFESFLEAVLEEHFTSEKMKEFYMEAHLLFDKKHIDKSIKMFFGILEICDAIRKCKYDIDVVRLKTDDLDAEFDSFEQKVKNADYDFFTAASNELPTTISITYSKDHIYFYKNTNSFVHTYSINSSLNIDHEKYDFNNELYFVNDSMIFLFYVLSNYFYMKNNMSESSIGDALTKFERTSKRKKKIKTKSIRKLLEERIDGRRT